MGERASFWRGMGAGIAMSLIGIARHGHAALRTITYTSWRNMKARCNQKRHHNYPRYGALGISYDPRWEDFVNFLDDMGERPKGTTLDRIDRTKNYSAGNCRWATPVEQTRNREISRTALFRGQMMPLQEIANMLGVSYATVEHRDDRGQPLDGKRRYLIPDEVREVRRLRGAGVSVKELANKFGVTNVSVYLIVKRQTWKSV